MQNPPVSMATQPVTMSTGTDTMITTAWMVPNMAVNMAPPGRHGHGGFTLYYNIKLASTPRRGGGARGYTITLAGTPESGGAARGYNIKLACPPPSAVGGSRLYNNITLACTNLWNVMSYIASYFSNTSLYLGQIWPRFFVIFQAFLGNFASNYCAVYVHKFASSRSPFDCL